MSHDARSSRDTQSALLAQRTHKRLVAFVWPLLTLLNQQLDVRLVRTFLASLHGIVLWRNRAHGLLLSELGAFIASPELASSSSHTASSASEAPARSEALRWRSAAQRVAGGRPGLRIELAPPGAGNWHLPVPMPVQHAWRATCRAWRCCRCGLCSGRRSGKRYRAWRGRGG